MSSSDDPPTTSPVRAQTAGPASRERWEPARRRIGPVAFHSRARRGPMAMLHAQTNSAGAPNELDGAPNELGRREQTCANESGDIYDSEQGEERTGRRSGMSSFSPEGAADSSPGA